MRQLTNLSTLSFDYDLSGHEELPHVVKFSGGRTSGYMLFSLLNSGILSAARGDVVLFNNTSAEHPATYDFVARCKEIVEQRYGIPFFMLEYQTYEEQSKKGDRVVRKPTFRMVNAAPKTENNTFGYAWRGEVFEEHMSHRGGVPSQLQRSCTVSMKLEPTHTFLLSWLTRELTLCHLGPPSGSLSARTLDSAFVEHVRRRGGVPEGIFKRKKEFQQAQPPYRLAQNFVAYSAPASVWLGEFGENIAPGEVQEYVTFIGLRKDEPQRVARVKNRQSMDSGTAGEWPYMPLYVNGITQKDIDTFWRAQSWDLELPHSGVLSNCTYCFLKGVKNLRAVRDNSVYLPQQQKNTPSDIAWWVNMEKKYARDLIAENRITRSNNSMFGFFGPSAKFSYSKFEHISAVGEQTTADIDDSILPCDCTD